MQKTENRRFERRAQDRDLNHELEKTRQLVQQTAQKSGHAITVAVGSLCVALAILGTILWSTLADRLL